MQLRASLEKSKQALEKQASELSADLRSLSSSKQDLEHKRKRADGQLADLQLSFSDSERQRAELGERVTKITVRPQHYSLFKPFRTLFTFQDGNPPLGSCCCDILSFKTRFRI